MPLSHKLTDHNPLLHETEMIVRDIDLLAQHIGHLILGKHRHVAEILAAKYSASPPSTSVMIDRAIKQLTVSTDEERHRRDGWLFQYMTWITMRMNVVDEKLITQPPHENPGQHGIDGLGIILTANNEIKAIIIAEDKFTENPRKMIREMVWPEFALFEKGEFDSQLVNKVTGLLNHLDADEVDKMIANDIYKIDNRIYRAGITPLFTANTPKKRKKLFKDYDKNVKGVNHERRHGVTFTDADIRAWMDNLSKKIINSLESQRP
jgi:hypothetical protein